MTHNPQILINNLTFSLPNGEVIFHNLSLAMGIKKTAIVGKNGIGKTTLIRLITGELQPLQGTIQKNGTLAICPQDLGWDMQQTISEVFAINKKIDALKNIRAGLVNDDDFAILNDDWQVEEKTQNALRSFDLHKIPLEEKLENLSGGEITRAYLAKTFASQADFIILDEPTNNLDIVTKNLLAEKIKMHKKGLILISHDRKILELMEQIIEITSLGIKTYTGNFSQYLYQKNLEVDAQARELKCAKKIMQKTQSSIQISHERREQQQAKGERVRRSGSQPKVFLDFFKDQASKKQKNSSIKATLMLKKAEERLRTAKEKIEIEENIILDLEKTNLPNKRQILKIENLYFAYPDKTPIIKNLSLSLIGPERIAIIGKNGSGKTTLIKLILGEIKPKCGNITLGTNKICYLDQYTNSLQPNQTILDNFKLFNPTIKEAAARTFLAHFLFRNNDALKLVNILSGGEKLRALLACILLGENPPELLILDEPTNYLDLNSIVTIENALNNFKGALIVISHDEVFINNIGVSKTIEMLHT